MTRIALFGTSADPPTTGHQTIIDWLSQHFDWVAVWASDNPFKSHQTPLEHRAAMLRLLIKDIDPPRYNVGLYQELSSPRTLETVEKAKSLWPKEKLTLIIGSDLVNQLPRWYKVEDLLRQVELLVVPRPGSPIEEISLGELRSLGAKIAIASLYGPNVSSTAYRQHKDPTTLTPTIEAYIDREQLYECQDARREKLHIR
ncbi:nicotinic acid mononucleotide adenylyltransferase [[Phormidium ambiguum] IAM M-71]|uniref:Probable nicotinate-nucleotide adenylyltransferase n=1 Tax=[Phormidium ambiguum] IAM M-71 TaxID=454136 RepID=A0A1U7I199_9CYAN|nr:nicotinate-nucleotide adenylyltransferase [Phormidium ambiguum]OKH29728.1 nicotinic acid mononucleotide adenylyltransferase [Phormidium ambiguum IAM M-71]